MKEFPSKTRSFLTSSFYVRSTRIFWRPVRSKPIRAKLSVRSNYCNSFVPNLSFSFLYYQLVTILFLSLWWQNKESVRFSRIFQNFAIKYCNSRALSDSCRSLWTIWLKYFSINKISKYSGLLSVWVSCSHGSYGDTSICCRMLVDCKSLD